MASFRGEFAAASLKQNYVHGTRARPRRFRGEFAAASLKHLSGGWQCGRHWRFRGEFAAASLKQDGWSSWATNTTWFPRRIRRGLIEADG